MSSLAPTPETTPVREAHRFDETKLKEYLCDHLDRFIGDLSILQFEGGQSNPTFLLDIGKDRYVLRKKPPGQLLPSAHAVEREYRVMAALKDTGVAVPKVALLCEDASVIGTPFFIMQYIEGRVFRDPLLPGMEPKQRAEIYDALNEMMARLHKVDYKAIGLSDYGRTENYVARQIARWSKQYEASKIDPIPAMDELMAWLPEHIPAGDDTGIDTSIVHGDFRLENTVVHPTRPEILAVLDWELSTLGHPLSDLAYNCLLYHFPRTENSFNGFANIDYHSLGIPSEDEYIASYCKRTGRDGVPDLKFFIVFAIFRSASIAQGIAHRAKQGIASSAKAAEVGKMTASLAQLALRLAHRPA